MITNIYINNNNNNSCKTNPIIISIAFICLFLCNRINKINLDEQMKVKV